MFSIPDRFNDLFADRGWIMYERMNLEVAKAAVEKAEKGDVDGAEQDLVAYYSNDHVAYELRTMISVQAFRPRMRLAEKALTDYVEERYHACVPVVLAQLDGMVNDLHKQRLGFFTKETRLEAWDSIAAHSKGLNAVNRIFQKSRKKTVVEQITILYRHGILHGMDLGYDNQMVAAKCWAVLFAAREWALKVERGELAAPPEEPKPTWRETFQKLSEIQRQKDLLAKWQPRQIEVGVDVPATGEPVAYAEHSPERRLAEYLHFWMQRNYGYMARCVPRIVTDHANALPGIIRERLGGVHLQSYKFTRITDAAAAVSEIETTMMIARDASEAEHTVTFRLIHQDTQGHVVIRGEPNGEWMIFNWGAAW